MENFKEQYNSLSKSEKKCFNDFEELNYQILVMTLNDLSDYCCVSTATINRTINKLGFNNLKAYKKYIKDNLFEPVNDFNQNAKENILNEIMNINNYDEKGIKSVINIIKNAPKIYVIGFGFTSSIALELSLNLNNIGYNSLYISDQKMFDLIHCETDSKNDVIIYVSFSGSDMHMEKLSIKQERLRKQVLITANSKCPIANCCHYILSSNTFNRDQGLNIRIPLIFYTTKIIIGLQPS